MARQSPAAPCLGHTVHSGMWPGGVVLSISQAPLVPALGMRLPLGQEVVGHALLGCLLEGCEVAESPLGGVEQAGRRGGKPPNSALVFLPLGLTELAVPTMP